MSLVSAAMARRDLEGTDSHALSASPSASNKARLVRHEDEWFASVRAALDAAERSSDDQPGAPALAEDELRDDVRPAVVSVDRFAARSDAQANDDVTNSRELVEQLRAELRAEQQLLASVLERLETESEADATGEWPSWSRGTPLVHEPGTPGLGADLRFQLTALTRHHAAIARLQQRLDERSVSGINPPRVEPDGR